MSNKSPSLRQTPLRSFHERHGARFVDFFGWEMPVQYNSILEEHRTVRTAAGLFDVSHMGEISVSGPEAGNFLDHLLTNQIANQPNGKAIYSPMCNRDGGTVDDLLVYKKNDDDFLLVVNASNTAKDFDWIQKNSDGFNCKIEDLSDQFALLALQGPNSAKILEKLTDFQLETLKPFRFEEFEIDKTKALVSRTGYTGEDGFEIYLPPADAEKIADSLIKTGESEGLKPAGLGARDSLRLEAGFPLYGHELTDEISPIQTGLGWTVKFAKEKFIGRSALLKQKENGVDSKVVFFRTGGRRIFRPESPVFTDDQQIGEVLSGTLSPMLNEAIGTAMIKPESEKSSLSVELRGKKHPIEIVKPPFHSS